MVGPLLVFRVRQKLFVQHLRKRLHRRPLASLFVWAADDTFSGVICGASHLLSVLSSSKFRASVIPCTLLHTRRKSSALVCLNRDCICDILTRSALCCFVLDTYYVRLRDVRHICNRNVRNFLELPPPVLWMDRYYGCLGLCPEDPLFRNDEADIRDLQK